MTLLRWSFLFLALSSTLSHLSAQTYYRGERTSVTQPSTTQDLLALHLSAEGFFRNDEYASDLVADYTLPGYRLQVDLDYSPRTELPIELRLGLYHQYYWGASRYPAALAYQDLPYWRGDGKDYTRFRALPFFRASIQPVRGLAILLGHLEGGAKHELIAPLYSPELNLTADPETGLQIRYEGKHTQLDTWVDWQSFIFKGDTHPEAFVFGLHARQAFPLSSRSQLELQLQALAHHRGGVLNERADTVHTWLNSALGLAYEHHFQLRERPLTLRTAVYGALYSQRGEHYPLDKGWGIYAETSLRYRRWRTELGYWYGSDFVSVLGPPFVQSLGRAGRTAVHSHHPRYFSWSASYSIIEREHYTLGLSGGVWVHPHSTHSNSSYIEAYLSISPYFGLIKR